MNGVTPREATPSRATSISRASKAGSTMSRSQSLIKKNIAALDLRPADVLIERFSAWKAIVKQLTAYFEGIADIHNNMAREMTKLGAVIQVPFRSGNQFLGDEGIQSIFFDIRKETRVVADQHANLGRTVEGSIVQHLQKLCDEIKAHIKNVQNDTGKLATSVAKERELSSKYISDLAASLSAHKHTPMNLNPKFDPYVINQFVHRQLLKQVHEENLLQKSIVIMQQNSAHFEEGIVRAIQSAWQTFNEWQSRMDTTLQAVWARLGQEMAALPPDKEWISFSARSDHLLDPETPLRNPNAINYPGKDDPSIYPVHTGHLERKKRFTRAYIVNYYVLTPAGFLHGYPDSDPHTSESQSPNFSLFLPTSTLGPPSNPRASSHKFHIQADREGTGATKTGSIRKVGSPSAFAWYFRSRSHDDMMEWWNDIKMLCARYLVASDSMERGGVVDAAVKSVGYPSDEELEAEEESGSSIEEERGEEVVLLREGVDEYEESVPPGAAQGYGQLAAPPLHRDYDLERKVSPRPDYEGGGQEGTPYFEERQTAISHTRAPPRSPPLQVIAEAGVTHSPRAASPHPAVVQYWTGSSQGPGTFPSEREGTYASGAGFGHQHLSRSVSPGHPSGVLSPPISTGYGHVHMEPSSALGQLHAPAEQPSMPSEFDHAKGAGPSTLETEQTPLETTAYNELQHTAPIVGASSSKFKEGL